MISAAHSMNRRHQTYPALIGFLLLGLLFGSYAEAKKIIDCPDGKRYEIDLKSIAIERQAKLVRLELLGARVSLEPKTLQQVAATAQQLNEILKFLLLNYNSCAITKEAYDEAVLRILPRVREDGKDLEQIVRKVLSEQQRVDEKRLQRLLDSYLGNLTRLAEISGADFLIDRITKVVEESGEKNTAKILERIDKLQQRLEQARITTPAEVQSEIRAALLDKADAAEGAYKKGYELLQRFHFAEAIPYLRQALEIVKLAEFHDALGNALILSGSEILERPKRTEADHKKGFGLVDEGLAQLETAAQAYSDRGLKSKLALVYQNLGFAYQSRRGKKRDDLRKAIDYNQKALDLLDCDAEPKNCIMVYGNVSAAFEWMPWRERGEREDNLEAALKAEQAAEPLVRKHLDAVGQAYFKRNLAVAIGHRFRGGRDKNLRRAIEISEEALPILEAHDKTKGTYVLLLNHLGTLYANLAAGDRMAHLQRAKEYLETGLALVGPDYFPEYHNLLIGNLAMVNELLKRKGALGDEEMLSRLSTEIDKFRKAGQLPEATREAWGFLHWVRERFGTFHVHTGMAHNTLGSLYGDQRQLEAAFTHLYCSLVVLHNALQPGDRLFHLQEHVQANLSTFLAFQGRGAEYSLLTAQAAQAANAAVNHLNRAYQLRETDPATAISELDDALQLFPCYPNALANRGSAKMNLADYEGALGDFGSALSLNPRDTVALFNRAQIFIRAGLWNKAVVDLDAALAIDPELVDANQLRAFGHEELGNIEEAIRDWQRVLAKTSDSKQRVLAKERLRDLTAKSERKP
jgi:tetratricopeptide (TPR) repeat protein